MYANCVLVFPSSYADNTGIQRGLKCTNDPNLEADGIKTTTINKKRTDLPPRVITWVWQKTEEKYWGHSLSSKTNLIRSWFKKKRKIRELQQWGITKAIQVSTGPYPWSGGGENQLVRSGTVFRADNYQGRLQNRLTLKTKSNLGFSYFPLSI